MARFAISVDLASPNGDECCITVYDTKKSMIVHSSSNLYAPLPWWLRLQLFFGGGVVHCENVTIRVSPLSILRIS